MKKNHDLLQQVPFEERIPQIEDSARAQEDEYEGLIITYGLRKNKEDDRRGNGEAPMAVRKRKIVDSDDEDEPNEANGAAKRAKV
jgi:hypothetical protein